MNLPQELKLTPSEKEAIEELKRRVSKDLPEKMKDDPLTYYRFSKAREFDVDAAERMIKQTVKWRKDNNVDSILTDYKPPEAVKILFKNALFGFDKTGSPVYYMQAGKHDIRGILMAARVHDIETAFIRNTEEGVKLLEEQSKKLNKYVEGIVYMYDLDGLTFGNATCKKGIECLIKVLKMQQANYPERLKAIYFINASAIFTIPYNILKNFLNERILSKFRVHGPDDFKEALLELMDADQLPAFLGGTRTDPDGNPLCKTFMNQGCKIPENLYLHKTVSSLENSPDVKKITLPRASFNEVFVKIEEPGSIIEWEFETKTRDIGFGLFYKDLDGGEENMIELVKLMRLETEDFSEVGMYRVDKSGEYVILFDNSYSAIRSKELYYRINVVKPTDHEWNQNNKIET